MVCSSKFSMVDFAESQKKQQKIYKWIKANGIRGLIRAVLHLLKPCRLKYYSHCEELFRNKIGLEIGGPSRHFRWNGLFPVYEVALRIDNCNFSHQTTWEGSISEGATFFFHERRSPGNQYIADATNLSQIPSEHYDFVLSSHTIEHIANPLQALSEWKRVLKHEGLLALVVPHKDGTFDHHRPVTSLLHLIQDFEQKTTEEDLTHLDEILAMHDLAMDPSAGDFQTFQQRSEKNFENRCLHHHAFDTRLAIKMMHHVSMQILAVEVFRPCDIWIIAQKPGRDGQVQNDPFWGICDDPF